MEQAETLTQEIVEKITELEGLTNKLKSLPPVTHKSQSMIQWYGGILGGIQEAKENKRLVKLINDPLVDGLSFYNIALSLIPQATDYLVERQQKIQQLVPKNDKRYYGFVVDIFNYVNELIYAWYNYSPDMANESLTIDDQKNVALAPSVNNWTRESISKLDLPPDITKYYNELGKSSNGCLGAIFAMFYISTAALEGTFRGLNLLLT